jgi:hypothetical protein
MAPPSGTFGVGTVRVKLQPGPDVYALQAVTGASTCASRTFTGPVLVSFGAQPLSG